MKTAFELQTQNHMTWLEHCELVKELTAQLAAKDAEISKLQPGYVEPEPPTVAQRIEDAILAALTDDEKVVYAKTIEAVKADVAAAEVAVKEAQPIEKEIPVDEK